jgi:hypothetical protein
MRLDLVDGQRMLGSEQHRLDGAAQIVGRRHALALR